MARYKSTYRLVIQARMGSLRFPGKVLANFYGQPMLAQQIQLLKNAGFQKITVATSNEKTDNKILDLCKSLNIDCYQGDEANVFSRYFEIAKHSPEENLIRLTGDNPIISHPLLNQVIQEFESNHAEFASTRIVENMTVHRFIPKGWSIDIFSKMAIHKVAKFDLSPFDKEHVIPAFYNPQISVHIVKTFKKLNLISCSVDTIEELQSLEQNINSAGGLKEFVNKMNNIISNYLKDLSNG
ncbi:MAG: NTP transferase domain-containing protein [Bdellovibrionales bacterium]|nr:NTP transferase domain-containing protein [Bdellovibrionales bacterium]